MNVEGSGKASDNIMTRSNITSFGRGDTFHAKSDKLCVSPFFHDCSFLVLGFLGFFHTTKKFKKNTLKSI